jgi:hypothetical protein
MEREARTIGELVPKTTGSGGSDAMFQPGSFAVGGLFPTPLVSVRLAGHAVLDAARADDGDPGARGRRARRHRQQPRRLALGRAVVVVRPGQGDH